MKRMRLDTTSYGTPTEASEASGAGEADQTEQFRGLSHARIARRRKFSSALVEEARLVFEQRLGRTVSPNEARNMLGDLTDFMCLLIEWEVSTETIEPEKSALTRPRTRRRHR